MKKEKFVLKVDGMMCEHCKAHVTDAIKSIDGVEEVKVDLKTKEATFIAPKEKLESVKKAIEEEGYKVL